MKHQTDILENTFFCVLLWISHLGCAILRSNYIINSSILAWTHRQGSLETKMSVCHDSFSCSSSVMCHSGRQHKQPLGHLTTSHEKTTMCSFFSFLIRVLWWWWIMFYFITLGSGALYQLNHSLTFLLTGKKKDKLLQTDKVIECIYMHTRILVMIRILEYPGCVLCM